MYLRHLSHGEWALGLNKPLMWKMKCFKFFLRRLSDRKRVLQQEKEQEETVRITRVEMSENLVEEMAW